MMMKINFHLITSSPQFYFYAYIGIVLIFLQVISAFQVDVLLQWWFVFFPKSLYLPPNKIFPNQSSDNQPDPEPFIFIPAQS